MAGVEDVDLANGFARADLAEQDLAAGALRGGVKGAGNDKIERVLSVAFLDEDLAVLDRFELAVAAEELTVVVAQRFDDALGRKFGCGEAGLAHGLG